MYLDYFGLKRLPFSIAPDPDLLYLSPDHQEALAHLNYALTAHGGLICLTGEVGMGKTTLCRAFIEQAPSSVDIAYIFNPMLSATELLQSICQELEISCVDEDDSLIHSNKRLMDLLYQDLIQRYSQGKKVICIIDEAQSMPAPLLEQIRLLTNLETNKAKLLTLILVGQPELQEVLSQHNIRQLDQRITARFHLNTMQLKQLKPYLEHRLLQAGCSQSLFDDAAVKLIWQGAKGIPRLINSISDRALLGAYANSVQQVTKAIAQQAIYEVIGQATPVVKNTSRNHQVRPAEEAGRSLSFFSKALLTMALVFTFFIPLAWVFKQDVMQLWQGNHYQQLAALNGLDINQSSLKDCQQIATNSELRCLSLQWKLQDLKRLQRPLAIYDGLSWQVIAAENLTIAPLMSLILWQPIPGFSIDNSQPVKPGESHELIVWVRESLQSELASAEGNQWQVISPSGQQGPNFQSFYDPILADKVASFQKRAGLKADRIIGLKTLLALQATKKNRAELKYAELKKEGA
jgi:general secretion pathway protein A